MPIERRLVAVRALMAEAGYDALIVPRADEYLGEYLPAHSERLRWVSGFAGSAGVVVILPDRAAIFVDGRYTVQVRHQVPETLYEYHHLLDEPPVQWLVQQLPAGAVIAVEPRIHTLNWYRDAQSTFCEAELVLKATDRNPIDSCWQDRPAPEVSPVILLDDAYTGESSDRKRRRIAARVAEQGADAALIFAIDSVSWLLNIRGTDVPMTPVVQSLAILESDGRVTLLVDERRIPEGFAAHVGEGVEVLPETRAAEILARYGGKTVLADPHTANAWSQLSLEAGGATLLAGDDPVLLPKACKNAVEIAGTRRAHIRDAVAKITFLCWLDAEVDAGRLHDEAVLADRLLSLRQEGEYFHTSSFDTISAAGENAAMCHYNHRNAEPASLPSNSVYLVDSGGQYTDGTTDITRTVAIGDPGPDIRRMYTLVLKGNIALSSVRFPVGTSGTQLDILARQFLWQQGFDYDHGTGHGGGTFLSVHEAPQRIGKNPSSVALRPGMILSNEPGYYRDGQFGIRCENLVVIRESEPGGTQETPMLEFDTLTLVPFDNRLLDMSLMSASEIDWLDKYHRRVLQEVGPRLKTETLEWLQRATRPLAK